MIMNDTSLRATTKAGVKGSFKQSSKAFSMLSIKMAGDVLGVCEPVAHPDTIVGDYSKLIEKLKNSFKNVK